MGIPKKNKDLRRYVFRKDLFRVLGYAVWIAIWYAAVAFYNGSHETYPDYRLILGWKLWLWLAASALIGFFLFRIGRFLTDRSFCGTVERADLSRSYSASRDPGEGDYDFRLNTYLRIRTDDGRKRRIRFEQKPGFYRYYAEGTRVVHFHGLPYPVNSDPTSENGWVCSACGAFSPERPTTCEICKHTLIDPVDLLPPEPSSERT